MLFIRQLPLQFICDLTQPQGLGDKKLLRLVRVLWWMFIKKYGYRYLVFCFLWCRLPSKLVCRKCAGWKNVLYVSHIQYTSCCTDDACISWVEFCLMFILRCNLVAESPTRMSLAQFLWIGVLFYEKSSIRKLCGLLMLIPAGVHALHLRCQRSMQRNWHVVFHKMWIYEVSLAWWILHTYTF